MSSRHRDVEAFHQRADGYERGWRGRLHHDIVTRTLEVALRIDPAPRRVLDVGCGTGFLVRQLAARVPGAVELVGVDAAAGMVAAAIRAAPADGRLHFSVGVAEQLAAGDGHFDLVVTTTSFDHWADQRAGLTECARVLAPGGHLVLTDQFSRWLWPTLLGSHRDRARTVRRAGPLLAAAGFEDVVWHHVYAGIIRSVTATRRH